MSPAAPSREPPVYRPFALLGFTAALGLGVPLGAWMLAWLYLGAPAVARPWVLLHAHLQIFAFFAALIPGVAPHLFARFTGRPLDRWPVTWWLAPGLATAAVLRTAGTAADSASLLLAAATLEAAAFLLFVAWVWRALDLPPLGLVRSQLTLASGWLAAAALLESALRWRALGSVLGGDALVGLAAAHLLALHGGITGWVLGVLLRAGPMFVPDWRVPPRLARAVPGLLAGGAGLAALGQAAITPAPAVLARAGEALATTAIVVVAVAAGAWRPAPRSLPMLARSAEEARIFRLAMASAVAAPVGFALAAAITAAGGSAHLVAGAARHLLAVGVLTSVVVAMTFRLIPVLERRALPWPGLRRLAFWALLGAVVSRTAEVLVPWAPAIAPVVPLSGFLVWTALAAVGMNLVAVLTGGRGRSPGA